MTDEDPSKKPDRASKPPSPPSQSTNPGEPQRRVYALPQEMVDRIVEFQKEKGLPSEVEAVRRLIDEALKSRDDLEKIINRFLGKLNTLRMATEVARDVLVGHPLVAELKFGKRDVTFTLTDKWIATVTDDGKVTIWGPDRHQWHWHGSYMTDSEIPF